MNKKSIIVLLVLVLSISGLFAKDSGIKVGGQLGWGFDIVKIKIEKDETQITKMKNNGFAFNLTGEYDFDENWGVVANLGMMFAGKTTFVNQDSEGVIDNQQLNDRAGLYVDFALDAKYTYAINEKVSVAGLAGLELVAGQLVKSWSSFEPSSLAESEPEEQDSDLDLYNVALGLNLGVEGSYKITDKISIVGGATGAWFFVNTSKAVNDYAAMAEDKGCKVSVASFYIRPYVGATYSF